MDGLTELFRQSGFESVSMADIAAATGLQKSSLYHRFPGGKAQMAAEVIAAVGKLFADSVFTPLAGDTPPAQRVRAAAYELDEFYQRGAGNCLLDVLSIGRANESFGEALSDMAASLIAAFTQVALEAGAEDDAARIRAEDAVAAIEGALVLARVTGDRGPFARAINSLPDRLVGGQP